MFWFYKNSIVIMSTDIAFFTIWIIICVHLVVCVADDYKYAVCNVKPNLSKPNLSDNVEGNVYFKQKGADGRVMMLINLKDFDTTDEHNEHGFHIHEYGTIDKGCEGSGGHYNPHGVLHGSPLNDIDHRHVGDLGNILEASDGTVMTHLSDDLVSLVGNYSVMGRTVVIHQKKDDLGIGGNLESLKTGNAGTRLACCIISAEKGEIWQ